MKTISILGPLKKLGFAAIFPLLVSATVLADTTTPDGTVREIVDKMKKDGNPAVVVDYVNWDKAYANFPAQHKEQLGVKSAPELKAFFVEMLTHPSATVKKQMEARLSSVPPEKQAEAKEVIKNVETKMKEKEVEMRARLKDTKYEVGAATIEGNMASVPLNQTYKDEQRKEDVKLEKDGEKWMLPSMAMAGDSTGPVAGAAGSGK